MWLIYIIVFGVTYGGHILSVVTFDNMWLMYVTFCQMWLTYVTFWCDLLWITSSSCKKCGTYFKCDTFFISTADYTHVSICYWAISFYLLTSQWHTFQKFPFQKLSSIPLTVEWYLYNFVFISNSTTQYHSLWCIFLIFR